MPPLFVVTSDDALAHASTEENLTAKAAAHQGSLRLVNTPLNLLTYLPSHQIRLVNEEDVHGPSNALTLALASPIKVDITRKRASQGAAPLSSPRPWSCSTPSKCGTSWATFLARSLRIAERERAVGRGAKNPRRYTHSSSSNNEARLMRSRPPVGGNGRFPVPIFGPNMPHGDRRNLRRGPGAPECRV
jgi:hypothetical protein